MTRVFLTIGLVFSILCSFACVQKGGTGTTSGGGDTIKVGVYGDLTGQTSSFGQSTKNGVELAVEEINAAGGVGGKKIQLVVEDDQGRPEQAKTVVLRRGRLDQQSCRGARRAGGQDTDDIAIVDESEGHGNRRLHFARLLYRSVPGLGDGKICG